MRLDVGCEYNFRGDVNVDVNVPPVASNKLFIRADAQHLPFQNNVFDESSCFHVIEHVENPYLLVKELLRVTKYKVVIKCPHRFSFIAKGPDHIHYFRNRWFHQIAQRYGVFSRVQTSLDVYRDIYPLSLEITATLCKKREVRNKIEC